MNDLHRVIRDMTDQQLLAAYFREKEQYTADAIDIMRAEIAARNLGEAGLADSPANGPADGIPLSSLKSSDFIEFDHSFSNTDLLLASAVLRDNNVIFFANNPASSDTIPIESEADKRHTIRVHASHAEKAHALLDEHFVKIDNRYLLRYTGTRDRLKAFSFSDIRLSEQEAAEELGVDFSADEKKIIVTLGRRLLREADAVEKNQDRLLFYYDSIEPLIERLENPGCQSLPRNDLLAILELCQVYADSPDLPAVMDEAIAQILKVCNPG